LGDLSLMETIFRRLRKFKANSFTLVELLVVISIIGLLAGLAVPAIQGGLDKAKQGVDVSNARQLGIIFFSEANDNNGIYRVNSELTNTQAAQKFLPIIQGMVSNGLVTTPKILSGQGATPAASTNNIIAANIAFGYVPNLTTSDDGNTPLIITKGPTTLSSSNIQLQDTYPWKKKGLVIYRLGNSAEFLKSGTLGAPVGSASIGMTNSNSILQP
jgi:prepilin-type N-terminal cleavage/methylation domain-containing protein